MEQSFRVHMLIAWVRVGRFLQNVNTLNICAFGELLVASILNYILQLFIRVRSMYQNKMCLIYSFSKVSLLILVFCYFYHTKHIFYCLEKMNSIILVCVCVFFNTTFSVALQIQTMCVSLCYCKGFLLIRHKNNHFYYSQLSIIVTYR